MAFEGKDDSALLRSPVYKALFGTELRVNLTIFALVLIIGLAVGFGQPPDDPTQPQPYRTLSSVIGWIYFAAWSISFWPQVLLNWHRKSVVGLSFDYIALNLVGFSCYTAYNTAYYYNPSIRAAYAAENNGSLPSVRANDVFFAIHAVALTLVNVVQIFMYDRGGQTVSVTCRVILVGLGIAIGLGAGLTAGHASSWWTWLHYCLYLSYVKLAITLMKYIPQTVLNWRRKSTAGWNIYNVLLDFTGGLLSLGQLLMDCAVSGDWSGIQGDPVKFGLGLTSMVFDVIFMAQHYLLYPESKSDDYAAVDGEEST